MVQSRASHTISQHGQCVAKTAIPQLTPFYKARSPFLNTNSFALKAPMTGADGTCDNS